MILEEGFGEKGEFQQMDWEFFGGSQDLPSGKQINYNGDREFLHGGQKTL